VHFFQPAASTADGETFLIQEFAYAAYQQYFVVLVITTIAASLDWAELCEFLLPVAQDMWLDAT